MPAYVIARVEVRDWDRYRQYMQHTPAVIAKFGGRFIVRGAEIHTLEGTPDPRRIVIIEFPSLDHARAFHASDDYAPVKALRDGAGEGQFIAVDGFAPEAWDETLTASVALGPPA